MWTVIEVIAFIVFATSNPHYADAQQNDARVWTDKSGRTSTAAKFLICDSAAEFAYFRSPDGRNLKCRIGELCDEDARLVLAISEKRSNPDADALASAWQFVASIRQEPLAPLPDALDASFSEAPTDEGGRPRKELLPVRIEELNAQWIEAHAERGLDVDDESNQRILTLNRLDLVISAAELELASILIEESGSAGLVPSEDAISRIESAQERLARLDIEILEENDLRTYRDLLALDREITRTWLVLLQTNRNCGSNLRSHVVTTIHHKKHCRLHRCVRRLLCQL